MSKPSRRSKVVLAGIAVLIVPLLLVCAEGITRMLAGKIDPLTVFVASPQLRSDTQGEHTSGLFEFDPLLTWRLRPDLRDVWWDFTPVRTNGAHLRTDREVAQKKGIRVLCLGDSVTFGYRVPVAHDRNRPSVFDGSEQPYPALLEKALRGRFPGKEIEVFPLACPGYTSGQGAAWLQRDIAKLQPDLVTACFGWNDTRAAGLPDRMTFPTTSGQVWIRGIMARSQLLLHLAKSAQARRARELNPITKEPRSSAEEYVRNFETMRAAAQANGAWFGIILPVYRDPNTPGDYPEAKAHPGDPAEGLRMIDYRDRLAKFAEEGKVPHLRINELTEGAWPGNAELFGERIHPNAAGHRLMAERLTEFLAPAVAERAK